MTKLCITIETIYQATAQATSNEITLKGSTEIVTEFFEYSINNILYQRGVYSPESFKRISKYGLPIWVTEVPELKTYLDNVLDQLRSWLLKGNAQKLVMVVTGCESKEVLERWVFNVETDKEVTANPTVTRVKSNKEIMNEIQAIMRQITASVTFLPLLEESCTFDLLVHTDIDAQVPLAWEESDPRNITNAEDVKLRSFSTKVHKVDTCVTYRQRDDDDI